MASNPIHEARRALGLKANGPLADLLGCDRGTLDAYAAGRREAPRTIRLALSAIVAGLPPYGEEAMAAETRREPR